jgi:hypothetical protein
LDGSGYSGFKNSPVGATGGLSTGEEQHGRTSRPWHPTIFENDQKSGHQRAKQFLALTILATRSLKQRSGPSLKPDKTRQPKQSRSWTNCPCDDGLQKQECTGKVMREEKVMRATAILAVTVFGVAAATADVVTVNVTGQVAWNAIGEPPLSGVGAGDSVELSFTVDSDNFVEGSPGDTRGYEIDQSSFSLTFDTPLTVGLLDPFPAGQTPYFTLVDGFPVSDGFFVSTSPFSPGGVPLEQEPVNFNLDLGYTGETLGSLDILDALGVYTFEGLTRFGFNLWEVFPDNVRLDMEFAQMTIVPEPTMVTLLAPLGLLVARRRR